MKVVAIKLAFFEGSLVQPGDQVEVPANFKAAWCAPVDSGEAKAAKPKPTKEVPRALSQTGKEVAKSFIDVHSDKTDLA